MKLSKEYMTFLEGHRQFMEFRDKLEQAAAISENKRLEESIFNGSINKKLEKFKVAE